MLAAGQELCEIVGSVRESYQYTQTTSAGCREARSSFFGKDPCVNVLRIRRASSFSIIKRGLVQLVDLSDCAQT